MEKVNVIPSWDVDMEFLSNMAVLIVPGLSFSRRRINRLAIVDESPMEVKVDRSPVGVMPCSSRRTLVGNLFVEREKRVRESVCE